MPYALLRSQILRSYVFVALLIVLALAVAFTAASMSTRSAQRSMHTSIERELYPKARDRVDALLLWHTALRAQTSLMADADVIRLYAAEALLLARTGNPSQAEELAVQRSLMHRQLQDFVTYTGFRSGRLLNPSLQNLFATNEYPAPLSKEQDDAVEAVFATGLPGVTPVRGTRDGLMVDILEPVFAPPYMAEAMQTPNKAGESTAQAAKTAKPVAVLLLTRDISPQVRELERRERDNAGRATYLVQRRNGMWQDVRPDGLKLTDSAWAISSERLPLALRPLHDESVYSVGLPVSGIPWLVVQTIEQTLAEADFHSRANTIMLTSICSAVGGILLVGLGWWFSVGNSSHAMHSKAMEFALIVNRQRQLLTSLEDACSVGVALTDAQGRLIQVNTALATMLDRTPKALQDIALISLLPPPMGEELREVMDRVLQTGETEAFPCSLTLPGLNQQGEHTYRLTCTPFVDIELKRTGVITVVQDITEHA